MSVYVSGLGCNVRYARETATTKKCCVVEQPFSRCWDSKECRVFGVGKEEGRRKKHAQKRARGDGEERDKILCCVV